jgi:hypothetical protein
LQFIYEGGITMDTNLISQTEVIVHLTIQAFEGQIRIIHSLGNHPDRKQHIENLRRMIVALSEAVERNKEGLLMGMEDTANASVKVIANLRIFINNLANASENTQAKECAKRINEIEKPAINRIGIMEASIDNNLIQRSNAMQENILTLLNQVEALRP